MVLPQIIGFGAQKAGTTWLFENLTTNPGIWKPPLKEMHFFNYAASGSKWAFKSHTLKLTERRNSYQLSGKPKRAAHLDRLLSIPMLSEEWYREAYRPCPHDRQSLDITPAYALLDDDALTYMERILGTEFKCIYLIRDPAERAISAITKESNGEIRLDRWLERIRRREVMIRSDYRLTIQRLDSKFGDRVLYLPFGQIKADPVGLLRAVERHCGVSAGNYKAPERPSHVSPKTLFPDGLRDAVRDILSDQYVWLSTRFGAAYSELI